MRFLILVVTIELIDTMFMSNVYQKVLCKSRNLTFFLSMVSINCINKLFGSGHLIPIKEGRAGGKFFLGIFINVAYYNLRDRKRRSKC